MPPKRCIIFMKKILGIFIFIIFLHATVEADNLNNFHDLKQQLKEAGCIQIEFISSLESSVFDTVDSTMGLAVLSSDGRYNIQLGDELYLYDLQKSYSFSEGSNQVIIEDVDDPKMVGRELSFIKDLDELYITTNTLDKNIYKLNINNSIDDNIDVPDSMIIFISSNNHFDSLSFYDLNEDLNHIYFINQIISDTCHNSKFIPEFPDSVERVRF